MDNIKITKKIGFDINPINWIQNEADEQPSGVVVELNSGQIKYMTIKEYNTHLKCIHSCDE